MIVSIDVMPHDTLGQVVTQINNALSSKVRKLKKRTAPWPSVRLVSVTEKKVVYEVSE